MKKEIFFSKDTSSWVGIPWWTSGIRGKSNLDFEGNINYMEYVTKPKFELKMKKNI